MKDFVISSTETAICFMASLPSYCALAVTDIGRERLWRLVSDAGPMALILRFPRLMLVRSDGVDGADEGARKLDGTDGDMDSGCCGADNAVALVVLPTLAVELEGRVVTS
jgi:hypothetical protein